MERVIKVEGKQWEGSGTGRERGTVGGINHPTLNPSYATTLGYSGPWLYRTLAIVALDYSGPSL